MVGSPTRLIRLSDNQLAGRAQWRFAIIRQGSRRTTAFVAGRSSGIAGARDPLVARALVDGRFGPYVRSDRQRRLFRRTR